MDRIKQFQAEAEQEESYDTSNKEEVNTARKKSARTRADRLKFIEACMQHEQGRAWFYDFLTFCGIWSNCFQEDPYKTAFLLGQRNCGLRVLDDIQTIASDNYILMVNENSKGRRN